MRPDLDDFDDLNDATDAPRSRAMSWVVLVVAVTGFAALAYYAYHSGTQSVHEGDMLVVQADGTPIKQVPENPEGEQFPNKDKTIYDVISPNNGADQKVEKLLPDPEQAVAAKEMDQVAGDEDAQSAPSMPPSTTTYVNKNMETATPPVAEAPKPVAPAPVAAAPAPVVTPGEIGAPTMINQKPATAKKETTTVSEVPVAGVKETKKVVAAPKPVVKPVTKAVEVAKPAVKPVEKPVAAATGSSYKVQLGAFKSEAEAQAAWKKISAKYPGAIHGGSSVVKADLANGTFYRLRAGGFASAADAKAACAKMSGQACIPVQ